MSKMLQWTSYTLEHIISLFVVWPSTICVDLKKTTLDSLSFMFQGKIIIGTSMNNRPTCN
jgi:hypothetical protein